VTKQLEKLRGLHIAWMDSKSGSMIFKNIHIARMDSKSGSMISRCTTIAIEPMVLKNIGFMKKGAQQLPFGGVFKPSVLSVFGS
jgi:hypothetical protein